MTTAEEQLSRLLDAAAPDGAGVDLDDVASAVRRRRRVRETSVAGATVLAAVAAVVGIAVATPRAPASPLPPAVDLTDAVPWSDAPATAYQPPDGSTVDARPCTASDVAATERESDGAGGHLLTVISFTNRSATACVLTGYPDVTAAEPGRPDIAATDGSWFPTAGSAVMQPGDQTLLGVETDTMCAADPDGTAPSDPYHRLVVTLPGGGNVGVDVADGIDVTCGVMLTPFYVGGLGDSAAVDPLSELRTTLELPETFAPAEPLVYVVRLTNPTDRAISLDRCPSYVETLAGVQTYQDSYTLACGTVGEIGPHRSVRFEMRFAVPADAQTWLALSSQQPPSWPVSVTWSLAAPFDVSATGATTLVTATGQAAESTVTGTLMRVGGPPPGSEVTLPGTVTLVETTTGVRHETTTAPDGTFRLAVPAGEYTITGTSPQYGDGTGICAAQETVVVPVSGIANIPVTCQVP